MKIFFNSRKFILKKTGNKRRETDNPGCALSLSRRAGIVSAILLQWRLKTSTSPTPLSPFFPLSIAV